MNQVISIDPVVSNFISTFSDLYCSVSISIVFRRMGNQNSAFNFKYFSAVEGPEFDYHPDYNQTRDAQFPDTRPPNSESVPHQEDM